jgi:spore maturation protein CgeB
MDGIEVQVGNVQIVEDGVVNQQKTVDAYASVLRRIKVFVNLPTLSQLLVTKVFEVAASGACLVTPRLKGVGERNQELLGDVIQLYDDASPAELAGLLRSLLNDDQERERLAQRACDEIHKRHGIRQRLQTILDSFSGHLGN